MIFQLGVAAILASMSVASALPPCICTKRLSPVCGSDGQTYNNECLLNCAQASNQDLFMARRGRCGETDPGSEGCVCTLEYSPVCGSDGKSYSNMCALRCAQRSSSVQLAHHGKCRRKRETVQVAELPTGPICVCPFIYKPVCGNDGQTYDNKCTLECARVDKQELGIQHSGSCESSGTPCTCSREAKPVCGSDGNTYDNPCMLQCAMETSQGLVLQHFGACDNGSGVADPVGCVCTREMKPVCGTDGNTYSNPCLLNCARKTNEDLHISHVAPCDLGVNVLEDGVTVF